MKKYIILFLLVFLVTGCDSSSNNSNDSNKDSNVNNENNSQEKVEELLENNDFHCKDDICIKEYTDSDGYLNTSTINFSTYKYTTQMVGDSSKRIITYNWKSNYSETVMYIGETAFTAILTDDNELSCDFGYTDSCYAFKTRMIELKQNFADLLALADVEIEDLI